MHREIYRAIRSHNPALARQTMEQHLKLASKAQAAEADLLAGSGQEHLQEDSSTESSPTPTTTQ
jgi:DNA-binding FadR family transcriptional regulator